MLNSPESPVHYELMPHSLSTLIKAPTVPTNLPTNPLFTLVLTMFFFKYTRASWFMKFLNILNSHIWNFCPDFGLQDEPMGLVLGAHVSFFYAWSINGMC